LYPSESITEHGAKEFLIHDVKLEQSPVLDSRDGVVFGAGVSTKFLESDCDNGFIDLIGTTDGGAFK
jgi:hypothetical protein